MTMDPLRWKPARITEKEVPPHLSIQKPMAIHRKVLTWKSCEHITCHTKHTTATYQVRDGDLDMVEIIRNRGRVLCAKAYQGCKLRVINMCLLDDSGLQRPEGKALTGASCNVFGTYTIKP